MKFDSVAESQTPYPAVVDYEHEHRFAEHEHEEEPEQPDDAERKWRSAED